MPLIDTAIRNLKSTGKQKTLSFGIYPAVTLAQARKKRDEAKETIALGIDPSKQARQEKALTRLNAQRTFGAIAEEYLEKPHKEVQTGIK